MNLKLHLLIRMTLLGLLCWLGMSAYVVARSGRQAAVQMATAADQLQAMLAADIGRRLVSVDADARYPDLGGAASRFPEPLCLRYRTADGTASAHGCGSPQAPRTPAWLARLLAALGPVITAQRRDIVVFNRSAGMLEVVPDRARLIDRQWDSVRDLLGLAALTLLALDLLIFLVIGRALRPAAVIVAALEQLGADAEAQLRLPAFRPREFGQIAGGINRLAERLAQTSAARAALTARLIRLQESERRELAHELHEEFGQCVAALGAVSTSLRHSVLAGQPLEEADVAPLEAGVEQMLSSLRALLQRLSRPPLEQQGLLSAISDLVTAWQIRLHGSPHIVLDAQPGSSSASDPGMDGDLRNDEGALCAYRVVQECLSNIARHAPHSRTARVCIRRQPRQLYVRVSNDRADGGPGAASPGRPAGIGMGLTLLGERVRALHGTWSVDVSAEEFAVQAVLPVGAP
jgi:signal transduction histidine kinase